MVTTVRCGTDAKLLFIFRHRSPVTNEWREIVHRPIQELSSKLFNMRTHLLTLGSCVRVCLLVMVLNPSIA
jgi:hypothetical protein